MQTIKIGFSPCPNDTFIFEALVNNRIDTLGLAFEYVLDDVQTLNEWALAEKLPVSKVSYGVLSAITDDYKILNAGSALGNGVGPLLIRNKSMSEEDFFCKPVAIPGENTTANLLFSFAYPQVKNKQYLRFDEIENYVLENKGCGVIIHENRFTYAGKGLEKISDLGAVWEEKTGSAIPLGGIVISRDLDVGLQIKIDSLIKQSLEYAFKNYRQTLPEFVTCHAQEMSEEIMRKHIDLYVNEYTLNLGEQGKKAIETLLAVNAEGPLPGRNELFVPS